MLLDRHFNFLYVISTFFKVIHDKAKVCELFWCGVLTLCK